jgi:DNA-binding NtrC family response regulator
VEHFVSQLNQRHQLSVRGVTRQALRVIEQYPWRGNVRELEAVLESAMVLKGAVWITPESSSWRRCRAKGSQPTLKWRENPERQRARPR